MKLVWDGDNWTTKVALPEWTAYLPAKRVERVPVIFNPEGSDEEIAPTPAQEAAVELIASQQAKLLANVTRALRRYYQAKRPEMLEVAADLPQLFPNFDRMMPERPDAEGFARLHPLETIYVQPTAAKQLAHVGFSFGAAWEREHGIGVLVHGTEVREVGGSDTVILQWVAERDAKKLVRKRRTLAKKPACRR
jgi:hypothetical protein